MFSITSIEAAKKKITVDVKTYLTSDGSLYVVSRIESLEFLKEHCSNSKQHLFDVEENKEIEILKKRKN